MNAFRSWPAILLTLAFLAAPAASADTYEVDPVHSTLMFKVKHLGIAFVFGRFTDFSGTIVHDPANPPKDSVEIKVKASPVSPRGTVFTSFSFAEVPINILTGSGYDPITQTAELKVCPVRIEPVS